MKINYEKQTAWEIVYSRYEGMEARAVQFLNAEMGYRTNRKAGVYELHVLPCRKEDGVLPEKCALILGLYEESPLLRQWISREDIPQGGYCVRILDNPADSQYQYVLLCAHDAQALFYGAVDFIDDDCIRLNGSPMQNSDEVFDYTFPLITRSSTPKTSRRMIFTWGHPINDYRVFIRNMARQKLNEVILWNDYCPVNAKEIIAYAHSWGIKVIWGFAWGWKAGCYTLTSIDDDFLQEIRNSVLEKFEREYAPLEPDGIYFQSFTERNDASIGGRSIAATVTNLVNMTAGMLLEKYPDLKIEFGLHSSSVDHEMQEIARTDRRVEIIWEDGCAFPLDYQPHNVDATSYEKITGLVEKMLALRPGAPHGILYKGYCTLDWQKFVYQSGPYLLGEGGSRLTEHDTALRLQRWKYFQGEWMQFGHYAQDLTERIQKKYGATVSLGMAGMFDDGIWFPEAVTSRMFWDAEEPYGDNMRKVAVQTGVRMA